MNIINFTFYTIIIFFITSFVTRFTSIPPSAKEAAAMEGATAWEYFWKITLPYVSPMILANFIYTVIDSFTKTDNAVMLRVLTIQQKDMSYAYAAAMSWSYFLIVMAVVGIITLIISKYVFYEVD